MRNDTVTSMIFRAGSSAYRTQPENISTLQAVWAANVYDGRH